MSDAPYREEVLTTSNTKLAAILLVFGAKLRKDFPLIWDDVYESKDAFIEHLGDPRRSKPKTRVTYNFEVATVLREVVSAYRAENGEEEFRALVTDQKVLVAHSRAVAQACRETLEAREFLFQLRQAMPESAKWDVIDNVKLGKNCSDEARAWGLSK